MLGNWGIFHVHHGRQPFFTLYEPHKVRFFIAVLRLGLCSLISMQKLKVRSAISLSELASRQYPSSILVVARNARPARLGLHVHSVLSCPKIIINRHGVII